MAPQTSLMLFLLASLFLHTLLLYSPKDIHYKSIPIPISSSIIPRAHSLRPPAKRLVVFALESAQANDVFKEEMSFIRLAVTRKGRWGIAYSDGTPLSFLTGCPKEEEQKGEERGEIDHLLLSTSINWIWCSEHSNCLMNISTSDNSNTYRYDGIKERSFVQWITASLEELFLIKGNEKLVNKKLQLDKSLFYFSLDRYSLSLANIDSVIENVFNLFTSYFTDGKTTFIITSLSNETNASLPFVAWEAGIKNPRSKHQSTQVLEDDWSEIWGLDNFERLDIQQIDIAPLLSVLIGVHIPLRSLGTIPVPYLHYNKEFYTEVTLTNALQLLELVRAREEVISSTSLPFLFRPYKRLTPKIQGEIKKSISGFIYKRKLQEGMELSMKLINICKEALQYYHTYHHLSLKLAVTITVISWMVYLVTLLAKDREGMILFESNGFRYAPLIVTASLLPILLITVILIKYQSMSLHLSVYFMAPIPCLIYFIFNKRYIWLAVSQSAKFPGQFYKSCLITVTSLLMIELIAIGMSYTPAMILVWIILSVFPYFSAIGRKYRKISIYWCIMCLLMALRISCNDIIISSMLHKMVPSLSVVCMVLSLLSYSPIRYTLISTGVICSSTKVYIMQLLIVIIVTPLWMDGVPYIKWCIVILSSLPLLVMSYSVFGRLLHLMLYLFTLILLLYTASSLLSFIQLCFILYGWLLIEDKLTPVDIKLTTGLWDSVISRSPPHTVTSSLVPESVDKLQSNLTLHFRRTVIMIALLMTVLYNSLPLTSTVGYSISWFEYVINEQGFILMLSLMMAAIIFCYNMLSSLMNIKLENSLIIMVFILDILSLHMFHLMDSGGSLFQLLFHAVTALAVVIPLFMLCAAKLFTGHSLVAKKSVQHLN